MVDRVRHPRLLSAFRVALYLCGGFAAALLAFTGVLALLTLLVLAGVGVLTTGDVNLLAVGGLAGLVVLLVVGGLAALRLTVRHVERRVRRADRLPDPLDELTGQYVAGTIDERELEHRLDGLLDANERRRTPPSPARETGSDGDPHLEEEDTPA